MDVHSASILICTYNRGARLARTLDVFAQLPAPSTYPADIVVVDNNSTDDTASVVDDVSRRSRIPIRYVFERHQGKGFALNTGFARARGDVLALTDDDVRPEPDWLDRIVDALRTHDPVFVGGKVLPVWEAPPPTL